MSKRHEPRSLVVRKKASHDAGSRTGTMSITSTSKDKIYVNDFTSDTYFGALLPNPSEHIDSPPTDKFGWLQGSRKLLKGKKFWLRGLDLN